MQYTEIVVQGTLNADGTLQLDEKPKMAPGRVTVVLRPNVEIEVPKGDPFWQRIQAMWDAQKASGFPPRTVEEIDAQQREMHAGSAKRQEAIEQLQEEAQRLRQAEEEPRS